MHQFLTSLSWANKQLKYVDFVGNNSEMTQAGFQSELLFLVWKQN